MKTKFKQFSILQKAICFVLLSLLIFALTACQRPNLPPKNSSTTPTLNTAENAQKITTDMSLGEVKQLVGDNFAVVENILEPYSIYQWELTNGQYLNLLISFSGLDENPDNGLYVTEINICAQSLLDTTQPRNTLENAQNIQEGMEFLEIVDLLGTNFLERGSGATWFEWKLTNGQYAQVHFGASPASGVGASEIRIADEPLSLPGLGSWPADNA